MQSEQQLVLQQAAQHGVLQHVTAGEKASGFVAFALPRAIPDNANMAHTVVNVFMINVLLIVVKLREMWSAKTRWKRAELARGTHLLGGRTTKART